MKRARGFLLPLALLLAMLFGVIGGAFLQSQSTLYGGANQISSQLQARNLAEIGIEDVRSKLSLDINFPPAGSDDQNLYSYTEKFNDPFSGAEVGTYTITLDQRHCNAPYYVLAVRSVGFVTRGEVTTTQTVVAELDVSPRSRTNPAQDNPYYAQTLRWSEL